VFIYEIVNSINTKRYIGQTETCVKRRWREHKSLLRRNAHPNPKLQNAVNKHGLEQFLFNVLHEVTSLDELNALEIQLIEDNRGGYNIRSGGKYYKHSESTRQKISTSKKGKSPKPYKWADPMSDHQRLQIARHLKPSGYPVVVSPEGKSVKFFNLREFARTHDMTQGGLTKLVDGKISQYKGWTLEKSTFSTLDRGRNISNALRPDGYPLLISPDGNTYKIDTLSAFASRHGLSKGCLSQLINKIKPTYRGWRLAMEN
jgi:hypothetical protein